MEVDLIILKIINVCLAYAADLLYKSDSLGESFI